MDLMTLPETSNLNLVGPRRLTNEEFLALPVPAAQLEARSLIQRLEALLKTADDSIRLDEGTLVPIHRHMAGIYMRELTMPPGSVIVGKRHAQEHAVMMTKGECVVVTERGQETLVAPCTFISPAGEKRALFIIEETTWVTVHRTDAEGMEAIEQDLILKPIQLE